MLKIFAYEFQKRTLNTKRFVDGSSMVLASNKSILKMNRINLMKHSYSSKT